MKSIVLILSLAACSGPTDDSPLTDATTGSSGTTATTASTGDTGTKTKRPPGPWTLRTTVAPADDLDSTAADGLCAALYENPKGPTAKPFATTTLANGGELVVTGIETTAKTLGILVELEDCKGQASTVLRSVTAVLPQHFEDLRKGDNYEHPTFVMTAAFEAQIRDGLDTLGAPLDPDQGFVFGFVRDPNGDPIAGATVSIEKSAGALTTYYVDDTPGDGILGTDATAHATTIEAGKAGWIVPVGPVASLSASHPDYQFAPQANISLPLEPRAVFVTFVGVPK